MSTSSAGNRPFHKNSSAAVPNPSRRRFLAQSGGAVAGLGLSTVLSSRAYAGEDNTIKIALVGCGSRGTGAAVDAMSTEGPTQLWAMADVFPDHIARCQKGLIKRFGKKAEVPPDRQFVGMDAFKKAIDTLGPGDVVLLVTPPAFRPIHLEYAVERGVNVFMEKSFAVDAPGVHRVIKAGEAAEKKNLKVAGGLMCRHHLPLQAIIKELHAGKIGELVSSWVYREHGPVPFKPRQPGMSELAHQINNYSCYTWLNGSFLLDWLIHNLDIGCWAKNAWPVAAQGMGGRQVRTEPDQLFDHYSVEYTFADGTRLLAQGRHMTNCWQFFGNQIHGTNGSAILGEGQWDTKLFKGYVQTPKHQIWHYDGPAPNRYQYEHVEFFDAIRNDKPYNETQRCAMAAMTGILGRMAVESGKRVTWDQAMASKFELAPGLDHLAWTDAPPVVPDPDGNYPLAMPGMTKAF
ncbi:MAG: Gfo/Idh/MocA family oxidoreductase [Pirellulales bacterium]|nr:Gfo/Idh/MocA family oxidoreductase [Pirellulales bacterium]